MWNHNLLTYLSVNCLNRFVRQHFTYVTLPFYLRSYAYCESFLWSYVRQPIAEFVYFNVRLAIIYKKKIIWCFWRIIGGIHTCWWSHGLRHPSRSILGGNFEGALDSTVHLPAGWYPLQQVTFKSSRVTASFLNVNSSTWITLVICCLFHEYSSVFLQLRICISLLYSALIYTLLTNTSSTNLSTESWPILVNRRRHNLRVDNSNPVVYTASNLGSVHGALAPRMRNGLYRTRRKPRVIYLGF